MWGWSGGGSNTLNLLFRFPDCTRWAWRWPQCPTSASTTPFTRSATWACRSRTPRDTGEGSAINFAEGLKGDLLIVHGSGDDNVHYQATELLVNRLIELGKPFEFMTYPDRTHAISEGPGTTLHLFRLLTRYLTGHLPAGTR